MKAKEDDGFMTRVVKLHDVNEFASVFLEAFKRCWMQYVKYSVADLKQATKSDHICD